VPAPVAEGRSQLLKSMGVKGLMETIGMVISIKQLLGGQPSKKMIGAQIGLAFGGSTILDLTGSDIEKSIVPHYKAFSEAHKSHKEIPAEAYAGFVLQASSELQNRGHVGQLVAMEIGKQYAAEKVAPGHVLKEIDESLHKKTGKDSAFSKRIAGVIAAAEAQHNAMVKARTGHGHAQPVHTQPVHVQNEHAQKKEYPVVGKFTEEYNKKQNAPTLPGIMPV